MQAGEGLLTEVAPFILANAFRGGIDGGQVFLNRCIVLSDLTVLRVVHLQPTAAAAHLTKAAQPVAVLQTIFLGCGKVEETQSDHAGAVL